MMTGSAISVSNVSKRFRLGETHDSLRDLLASWGARLFRRPDAVAQTTVDTSRSLQALHDVTFDVPRGDALGIIGPNGAGKSTMLKMLSGILRPDEGRIMVHGRLAALIEVGAGFHGDLTGRENIFLNGAILGMSRAEIRRKLDEIAAFAGLERFLDTPVKRYSSGMYARLGFSIAAHVDPDILLVDEVLSVGDAVFRLRCLERMRELLRGGTTLVFVTHDLDQMQSVCERALLLEGGRTAFLGPSRDAVSWYLQAMTRAFVDRPPDLLDGKHRYSGTVDILHVRFQEPSGREVRCARANQPLQVEVRYCLHRDIPRLVIELNMRAVVHQNLLSVNSGRDGLTIRGVKGDRRVALSLPSLAVAGGPYVWNVRMWDADSGRAEIDTPFQYPLVVDDEGCKTGVLCLPHQWLFDERPTMVDERSILQGAADPAAGRNGDRGTIAVAAGDEGHGDWDPVGPDYALSATRPRRPEHCSD